MKIYKYRDQGKKCHHRLNSYRDTDKCTPFNCPYADDCVVDDASYLVEKFKDSVVKEIANSEVKR